MEDVEHKSHDLQTLAMYQTKKSRGLPTRGIFRRSKPLIQLTGFNHIFPSSSGGGGGGKIFRADLQQRDARESERVCDDDNNARVVPTPEENNGPLKDQTGKDNARAPARAFTPKTMRWNYTCAGALNSDAKRKRFHFLLLAWGSPNKE